MFQFCMFLFLCASHVKRCLPGQTLVHNSTYAPQISLGIIVLGHDDLRSLRADKHRHQLRVMVTLHLDVRLNLRLILTMYMGEPHSVAAIVLVWR